MSLQIPQTLSNYLAALKRHDLAGIEAALTHDCQFIGASRILSRQNFLDMMKALYTGFPDWDHGFQSIEDRSSGNYAVLWHQTGTHTGEWCMSGMAPIAPTGKRVTMPPHTFYYRVASSGISLIFPEPMPGGAPAGILHQIGADAPPL